MTVKTMDELVSLCKRRGFIYQSNELYGGLQGLYDYGPLGVELKNNLKQAWWKAMVYDRDDVEGLDASVLTSPKVLQYSGHEDTFTDPLFCPLYTFPSPRDATLSRSPSSPGK